MRNPQPFPPKLIRDGDPGAELRSQVLQIDTAQFIYGPAFADDAMGLSLKSYEIGLPQDGGIDVVELPDQQTAFHRPIALPGH